MIEASQPTIAITPETPASLSISDRLPELAPQPTAAMPTAVSTTTIARVTSGPATATLNSVAGLSDSRSIRAMPPKIQSWMLEMPIPLRSATKAWPSSCRTIEPKKPRALTTASAKGVEAELLSPSTSP